MPRKPKQQTGDLFAFAADNRPSIVYMATNTVNGKRYIGITRQSLERRKRQHINTAKKGKNQCILLSRAIKQSGEEAFEWCILEHCGTYKAAAEREIALIKELKPEYNISGGGEGVANVGFRFTERAKRKRRKAGPTRYWLGKKRPDIAAKQREHMKKNPQRYWLGKKRSPETIQKIKNTKARTRVWETEKFKQVQYNRRKTIVCLNNGLEFKGLQEAAEYVGSTFHSMGRVLAGERKQIYGFRFKYKDAA